jgi:hypothetical protein
MERTGRMLALAALALGAAGCDSLKDALGAIGVPADAGTPPAGFATDIVAEQNAVRAGASPTPSPALDPFLWSETVAGVAQAWADRCVWGHNPDLHALGLGENIAASAGGPLSAAEAVGLWASEVAYYHYDTNGCDSGEMCGHYTQIVWRDTVAVGCARATCTGGTPPPGWSGTWYYLVCDYAPPGNWVGEWPY